MLKHHVGHGVYGVAIQDNNTHISVKVGGNHIAAPQYCHWKRGVAEVRWIRKKWDERDW